MSAQRIPISQARRGVTEAMIVDLVRAFYCRVRADEVLGPVFRDRLAGRWDAHLAAMVDFWSSVALTSGRYGGKPHLAHRDLALEPRHFERWLVLFDQTAREVCGEDAAFFIDRAHRIADSLMIGLSIGPKSLRLPVAGQAARP